MADRNQKTRLIDIAEKVGVSKGAVAAVLNGKNSLRIGRETSAKILAVAKELHYEPNITARLLAGKESMVIGALIDSFAPPIIYQMLRELEGAAAQAGYRVMIGHAHDNIEHFFDCYKNFINHGIDGVICFGHEYPGQQDKVRKFFADKKNIVFLGAPCFEPASYLNIEIQEGVRQAVAHLIGLGYRRIGIMTPSSRNSSVMKREDGFRTAMVEHGLECPPHYIRGFNNPVDHAQLQSQMRDYLENDVRRYRLEAVIAENDIFAAQLIREVRCCGMRVPEDLAVVGHDNEPFSQCCFPSLTTIDQKPAEVGRMAFEMLLECMKKKSSGPVVRKIKTELIIRESTCHK